MSVYGSISLAADVTYSVTEDLTTPSEYLRLTSYAKYGTEVGDDTFDVLYNNSITLDSLEAVDLNFTDGSLTDNFGNAITCDGLKFALIKIGASTGTSPGEVTVELAPWLDAAGIEYLQPEAACVHFGDYALTGKLTITNTSDNELVIDVAFGVYTVGSS
jgi:hypothetical protein